MSLSYAVFYGDNMTTKDIASQNYYVSNRTRMVQSIEGQLGSMRGALNEHFELETIDPIIEQTRSRFEELLPYLPNIGGRTNLLTEQIVGSALYLALYQVLKEKGVLVARIGKIIYDTAVAY